MRVTRRCITFYRLDCPVFLNGELTNLLVGINLVHILLFDLLSLTFIWTYIISSHKVAKGWWLVLFQNQHHKSTTCLYGEGLSCSRKTCQYGITFAFSVMDLYLCLINRQMKYSKFQFDGLVRRCCDVPRTSGVGLCFIGVNGSSRAVNTKETCFRVDNCKVKERKWQCQIIHNFTHLTGYLVMLKGPLTFRIQASSMTEA